MLTKTHVYGMTFILAMYCLLCTSPAWPAWSAGEDIDPASPPAGFSWASLGTYTYYYVDDSNDYVRQWTPRGFEATVAASLKDDHVKTHAGNKKAHTHKQYDFGDSGQPSKAKANTYWNKRFWRYTKCTKHTDATNKTNCHAWGFAQVLGGTYNYWINGTPAKEVYDDDATAVSPASNVANNDLLRYGTSPVSHTTLVTNVSSGKPSALKWKFKDSGLYSYSPISGHEWDTPYCSGTADTTKKIGDQDWTWTEDGGGNDGSPYRVN
ncbi:MAG TPA: hypothetical protein VMX13_02615 [Sedimentisphaerales bacterium]|nr:hypothetical protein [Sedimentisphaerales bacterium]